MGFFLLSAHYVDFLDCDLAVSKCLIYMCVTCFKMTEKLPYTESILVTQSCCVADCFTPTPNNPESFRSLRT